MIKELLRFLEDKTILILGFGIEGQSSYAFLRKHFPHKQLTIADKKISLLEEFPFLREDTNMAFCLGEDYLKGMENFDVILKTPGISLKDIDITAYKDKLTNQLALFLEYMKVFTIGVTGTKGKSTTSSLLYQMLKEQGKDVFLLGNIGEPIFNCLDNMKKDCLVVCEISSHALEYIKVSPDIAILLNIYEEHLDHYQSFEAYREAKFRIANFQKQNQYFIYNRDNFWMQEFHFPYKQHDYAISLTEKPNTKNHVFLKDGIIYCNNNPIMDSNIKMHLKGIHNLNNIMFAIAVADILQLDTGKMMESIQNFKTLEHRMEFVGNVEGVDYYNDSIATIPEATIYAIKAIKNIHTIIVGGKDRGINQVPLIQFLLKSDIENIICLPKTGDAIFDGLKNSHKNIFKVNTMEEAVKKAKAVTPKNTACILSPAASSYGYFKNFEERGKVFKSCVLDDF